MRKVRTAVTGSENSKEAAPIPAAALSAERAKPRGRASEGERTSTSPPFTSVIVFLRELSKIFNTASTAKMKNDRREAAEAGIYALKKPPRAREETRSRTESKDTMMADSAGIFTLSVPYAKPAVNASAESATISMINFETEKNKQVHLFFLICFIVCGYDIIDFESEEKNYG